MQYLISMTVQTTTLLGMAFTFAIKRDNLYRENKFPSKIIVSPRCRMELYNNNLRQSTIAKKYVQTLQSDQWRALWV